MFVSLTHFSCVASGSALLPAAVLSPRSLSIPLGSLSLLWEGLGLRVGQRRGLGALVEGGRGPGRGLQEPADGWMVQHGGVTLGSMLGDRRNRRLLLVYHTGVSEQLTDVLSEGNIPLGVSSFQHWRSNWPLCMPWACPSSSWLHWAAAKQWGKKTIKPKYTKHHTIQSCQYISVSHIFLHHSYKINEMWCTVMKKGHLSSIIQIPDWSHRSHALCSSSPKQTAPWWWCQSSVLLLLWLKRTNKDRINTYERPGITWLQLLVSCHSMLSRCL